MRKQKAFTLIELLVVIAIIGLLASIILVSLQASKTKARDAKRKIELDQIKLALELYYDKYNHYPRQPYEGSIADFVVSSNSQPWIYDDANNNGVYDASETDISEFLALPVDPLNAFLPGLNSSCAYAVAWPPNGPWLCKYLYAYGTDVQGQIYDLIALTESMDQSSCQSQCWKTNSISAYEGQNYYWCGNCGGQTIPEADLECSKRIYSR